MGILNNLKKSSGINLFLSIQLNLAQFLDRLFQRHEETPGEFPELWTRFYHTLYILCGLLVATKETYFILQKGKVL